MDAVVGDCWNAERSRRHSSSQNWLEVNEAEWAWFHHHDRQRRYCQDIINSKKERWANKQWASHEILRHKVEDMGVALHLLIIGISMQILVSSWITLSCDTPYTCFHM